MYTTLSPESTARLEGVGPPPLQEKGPASCRVLASRVLVPASITSPLPTGYGVTLHWQSETYTRLVRASTATPVGRLPLGPVAARRIWLVTVLVASLITTTSPA